MKELTPEERHVIIDKGTEAPFIGEYCNAKSAGIYCCSQCEAELYRSADKFDYECGWPCFDDEIPNAVKKEIDADGRRTEIMCAKCGGHLGHLFKEEGFTPKNVRHCVNSVSLDFMPAAMGAVLSDNGSFGDKKGKAYDDFPTLDTAIFAGGCFWGVEHLMQQQKGVVSVESGYIGGHVENPTYEQVRSQTTGHAEAVMVTFDPSQVSYEELTRFFFEIHDPTQRDGQGPDIGNQYRSEIFYNSPSQKHTAEKLISLLKEKGYDVATRVTPATGFYPAEEYHQDHYEHKGTQPYCHKYTKRF